MPLTTAAKVRARANWPLAVGEAVLTPHLASAARELMRWCSAIAADLYADLAAAEADDENRLAAEEVEECLAIAYAYPVLNTFALDGAPAVPKQIEDADFKFLDPEQAATEAERWRQRAKDRWAGWDWTDEGEEETGEPRCPWAAI